MSGIMNVIDGIRPPDEPRSECWRLLRSDTGKLYKLRTFGKFSQGPLEPLKNSDLENLARAYLPSRIVKLPDTSRNIWDWEGYGCPDSQNKWLGYLVLGAPIGKEPYGKISVSLPEEKKIVDTSASDFWESYSLSDMGMGSWIPRGASVWDDDALSPDISNIYVKGDALIQYADGSKGRESEFYYAFCGWHHWDAKTRKLRVYIDAPDHLLDQAYKPSRSLEWTDLIQKSTPYIYVGTKLPKNPTVRDVAQRMCFRNWVVSRHYFKNKKDGCTFEENVEIVKESFMDDYPLSPFATRSGPEPIQKSFFG